MLPLVTLIVLSGSPPAGGKPVVPVIFAQQLLGNSVGPELVNGQPSPSVEIRDLWLSLTALRDASSRGPPTPARWRAR